MSATSTSLRFALMVTASSGFLDTYTMLARGGVFANAQTGNVILLALSLTRADVQQSLAHLWPIVAFVAGVAVATHIKRGKLDHRLAHPTRWTMGVQILVLAVVGFVPATVAPSWVTVPITFIAALQLELFRSVRGLNYVAIATTGNLMRLVESWYDRADSRDGASRSTAWIYTFVVAAFAGGAVIGAFATSWWGVRAVWVPAVLLASTLVLFVIDQRSESAEPIA